MSETVDCLVPIAPAQAYAMQAREDQDAPDGIAGIFSLYDIEIYALIDPGPTHSYICIDHVFDRMPSVEHLLYNMLVTSPLGHSVRVNRAYKIFSCWFMIGNSRLTSLLYHSMNLS